MLTDLCEYLKNWFDKDQPKRHGTFTISGGKVQDVGDMLQTGQYFRIVGSVFNDGVYQYGSEEGLQDETFSGAVWAMAVPKRAVKLASDIDEWMEKYGGVDSENMSPYQSYSEGFNGWNISMSKGGGSSEDGGSAVSWQEAFKSRLARWRKI